MLFLQHLYAYLFNKRIVVLIFTIVLHNSFIKCQSIDSLKAIIKSNVSHSEKAIIFNKLSNLHLDIDLNVARKYADSAILLGNKLNNYTVISNGYVNFGNAHYYEGNLDSTLHYFQKSYIEISKTDDNNEIAASLNRLGLIYEAKSKFSDATEYYYQALRIYEASNYKPGLANIYNNLGVINDILENSEKSISYYTNALDLFIEVNDLDGQANVYNNLATLYADKNELTKAISFIKTSIEILHKNNRKSEVATAYYNASTFYEKLEKGDLARQMLDSALIYYKFSNNAHGIANVYDKEASLLVKQANFKDAINILHESLLLRNKVGNLNASAETLKLLSETYQEAGNFEKALEYYKSYTSLEDSIFSKSTKKAISELNIKYETAKKDKAISLLRKESQIKQFQNRFLIFLSIAFAVISTLLLYSFRTKSKLVKSQKEFIRQKEAINRLKAEKQKTDKILLEKEIKAQQKINELQKNKLEENKRELATSTLQILNKNKILSEIKTSISALIPSNKTEKTVIDNISNKLKDSINLDDDWEQFKMHFEKVNTGFFDKLQKQHPALTSGDLRVCAYIKINLSPKEIAQMLNISGEGINKRLYRIRKKIDLPSDKNLSTYLAEF